MAFPPWWAKSDISGNLVVVLLLLVLVLVLVPARAQRAMRGDFVDIDQSRIDGICREISF
jgi:hypothetical protein